MKTKHRCISPEENSKQQKQSCSSQQPQCCSEETARDSSSLLRHVAYTYPELPPLSSCSISIKINALIPPFQLQFFRCPSIKTHQGRITCLKQSNCKSFLTSLRNPSTWVYYSKGSLGFSGSLARQNLISG